MLSSKEKKREHLFETYSNNLSVLKELLVVTIEPEIDQCYICPICCKLFDKEALDKQFDDHLTLEHSPPDSLGGNVATLTCKICNNSAGAELEAHLNNKLHFDEFIRGNSSKSHDAQLKFSPDMNVASSVEIDDKKNFRIEYHSRRTNPKHIENMHSLFDNGELGEFNITFSSGYQRRPEIALLRIAYLLAFSIFGYSFIFNENIAIVRQQISNPSEDIIPQVGIITAEFPDDMLGINVITSPRDMLSFIVIFDLVTKNDSYRYGVILPGPKDPGASIYNWISQQNKSDTSIKFNAYKISNLDYLNDRSLVLAPYLIWNQITNVL